MQKLYGDQSLLLPADIRMSLKYGISELSDEELLKLYRRIKPIVKLKNGEKYAIDDMPFITYVMKPIFGELKKLKKRLYLNVNH